MGIFTDILKTSTKDAAADAAKDSVKAATKDSVKTVLKDSTKNAIEDSVKTTLKDSSKNAIENSVKTTLKDSTKTTAKDLAKYAALGAAAIGTGALLIAPGVQSLQKNNKSFNVTAIKNSTTLLSSNYKAKITFTPGESVLTTDTVTFSSTNCKPTLDGGEFTVSKVISDSIIEISVPEKITQDGTQGSMVLHTTYANQIQGDAKTVGDTVGNTVGGTLGGAASGVLGGTLNGVSDAIGIDTTTLKWIGIAAGAFFILVFLMIVLSKFL